MRRIEDTLIERILALTQTTPTDGLVQRCQDGKELRFGFFDGLSPGISRALPIWKDYPDKLSKIERTPKNLTWAWVQANKI